MRTAAWLLVAATPIVVGCAEDARSTPVAAEPRPRQPAATAKATVTSAPSASGSPEAEPPAPACELPIDERRARSLVLERPSVASRLDGKDPVEVSHRASCAAPWYGISIGGLGEFRVDAHDGAVEGQSQCSARNAEFVSMADWEHEKKAVDRLFDLPEVAGFLRMLLGGSNGKVWLVIRMEPCSDDGPYAFYVGERHEDHTVHWKTMTVDRTSFAITIVNVDGTETPYARWAATKEAKDYAAQGLPSTGRGGVLDYGTPSKTITDVAAWKHPSKHVLEEMGALSRVDMYGATYPVFILAATPAGAPPITWANRVLAANGYWPFEVVFQGRSGSAPTWRYRHTGRAWETMENGRWTRLALWKR